MTADPDEVGELVDRVPVGWSTVRYRGRRWSLVRSEHADGRSLSVYATELGGTAVVSANVYRTSSGDVLKPCEMPTETVIDFLTEWRVDVAAQPGTH